MAYTVEQLLNKLQTLPQSAVLKFYGTAGSNGEVLVTDVVVKEVG